MLKSIRCIHAEIPSRCIMPIIEERQSTANIVDSAKADGGSWISLIEW